MTDAVIIHGNAVNVSVPSIYRAYLAVLLQIQGSCPIKSLRGLGQRGGTMAEM